MLRRESMNLPFSNSETCSLFCARGYILLTIYLYSIHYPSFAARIIPERTLSNRILPNKHDPMLLC